MRPLSTTIRLVGVGVLFALFCSHSLAAGFPEATTTDKVLIDPDVPVFTPGIVTYTCGTGSMVLSIPGGANLNDAAEWYWYAGSCGGTFIGTGTSISYTPTGPTTIYVRGEGGSVTPGACGTLTIDYLAGFSVSMNIVGATTVCSGSSSNLELDIVGGVAPYDYTISDGYQNYSNSGYNSLDDIPVTVSVSALTFSLINVIDANGCFYIGPASVMYNIEAPGPVLYVNAGVSGGTNDGSTWLNAYADLDPALEKARACTSVEEIWVAAGSYLPAAAPTGCTSCADPRNKTFWIPSGIKVYGGFAGGETAISERPSPLAATILSGDLGIPSNATDNAYHVVILDNVNINTELNGLIIEKGNANDFNPMNLASSTVVPNDYGAGVFINGGGATLRNCTLRLNSADQDGGSHDDAGLCRRYA